MIFKAILLAVAVALLAGAAYLLSLADQTDTAVDVYALPLVMLALVILLLVAVDTVRSRLR